MLSELIQQGFGEAEDYNCAEKILYGANQAYHLDLDQKALKISAGFGGGMGMGLVCGALTGAIMALGVMFVKEKAHESTRIKDLTQELLLTYKKEMGNMNCGPLKLRYRTPETKCNQVIIKAAQILDQIVERERQK